MNLMQTPSRVNDYDLLTELNNCCKKTAAELTAAIMETSNPQARQLFLGALHNAFAQQQQLGQLMIQKGYYKAMPSSPQMIQAAREQIEIANAQVGGPLAPGWTGSVQPDLIAPVTGTGPIPPQMG